MFKSGFTGIIGRPNVGKSTLLNGIMGEKIAITTHKPQTTRNRITGIKNLENGQFIFLDTPGIHKAKTPLGKYMVKAAVDTFADMDLILLLVEADRGLHNDDIFIVKSLQGGKIPVVLVINKIDLIEKKRLLPLIDEFRQLFPFREIIPISALKGNGLDILLDTIWEILPEGPKYFPDDMITDLSERFLAAEIIREKVTLLTHQEIPYSTAVVVDSFKEDEGRNLIRIHATINVEKKSQKGILIGKRGSMLKEIGIQSRLEMEKFFAVRIYLELFIRVKKDWTKDSKMLKEFGY
ncbi:MAG: GTPase Era [Proteobacteria bacterium]|nr:GTPase Era [Pseudomonadota bacterium]